MSEGRGSERRYRKVVGPFVGETQAEIGHLEGRAIV